MDIFQRCAGDASIENFGRQTCHTIALKIQPAEIVDQVTVCSGGGRLAELKLSVTVTKAGRID